jgi:hypothetical protein
MISCVFRVTRTYSDPRNYLQKTTRRRKACAHHCWWWCMHHSRRRSLRSVPPVSHVGVRNSAASVVQRGQTVPGDRPADPNCDGNALDLTDARRRTHADAGWPFMNEHRRRSGVIGTPAAVTILSTGVCASEAHGYGRVHLA